MPTTLSFVPSNIGILECPLLPINSTAESMVWSTLVQTIAPFGDITSFTTISSSFRTPIIISFSSSSIAPSSLPMSSIVSTSSSDINRFRWSFMPKILTKIPVIIEKPFVIGWKMETNIPMGLEIRREILSAWWTAIVFGMISENVRIKMVIATIAMTTP